MATGGRSSTKGKMAEEDLVREHLPLVQYVAAEVASRVPRNVSRSDLASAAMEGLAQAARAYDAERDIAIDRYAPERIPGDWGLPMRPVVRPPFRIRRPIRPIAIILTTTTKAN